MLEDEIKRYYDTLAPSDEARNALERRVRRLRRKQAALALACQCAGSAAACIALALGINTGKLKESSMTDMNLASVISAPSGYVIAGILFILLLAVFLTMYFKKRQIAAERIPNG